jgi:hypothetical protein
MNRLFDLRFVIGIFFTAVGLLLLGYGFLNHTHDMQVINRWCGGIFSVFGILMILFSFRDSAPRS